MEQLIQFLDTIIFGIGDSTNPIYIFTFRNLLYISIVLMISIVLFRKYKKFVSQLSNRFDGISESEKKTVNYTFRIVFFVITTLLLLKSAGLPLEEMLSYTFSKIVQFLDTTLFGIGDAAKPTYTFTFRNLLYASIVLFASAFTLRKYQQLVLQLSNRFNIEIQEKEKTTISHAFRVILFWITTLLFFKSAGLPLEKIMNYTIWQYGKNADNSHDYVFQISMIVNSILVYFIIRIILWTIFQLLSGYYKREKMDVGSQYAINRLIKYVIYTIMILTIIEILGFQLTVLWGAAGALLVGFGLGLQQTFNDLFSGVLIMIEGSVHVGDMVKVKDQIGKVTKIGIRASEVRMRDDVELIVPNSHLVMDGIANWNHSDQKARFFVKIGVAYGTDTQLVKKILLDVAAKHSKVIDYPEPVVRFADFGNSSLDFELHFWTFEVFGVLNTQSDLRFEIDKVFREHKIEIPYPQRDLWIRNPKDLR